MDFGSVLIGKRCNRHYASKSSIGTQINRELVGAMFFEKQYEYGKKVRNTEIGL